MRERAVAVIVAAALAAGCGGAADEGDGAAPAREATMTAERPASPAGPCPTRGRFRDRWPEFAAGGPSAGPVTLALGRDAETRGVGSQRDADGRLRAKVLLLVDAAAGTPVRMSVAGPPGVSARLTHFSYATGWDGARAEIAAEVPDRGQGSDRPADVPGHVMATGPGCYAITVEVGGRSYGPLGFRLQGG